MGGMGMMQSCGMMEGMMQQGGEGMNPPVQKQEQPAMEHRHH